MDHHSDTIGIVSGNNIESESLSVPSEYDSPFLNPWKVATGVANELLLKFTCLSIT